MELFEDKGVGVPDPLLRGSGFYFPGSFRGQPSAGRGFSVKAQITFLIGLISPILIAVSAHPQEVAFRDTVYSVPEILVEAACLRAEKVAAYDARQGVQEAD